MADLTQGIVNMQDRLAPDAFGAFAKGASSYAGAVNQGQTVAKNRIEISNAQRQQDIQFRLQKAISESVDPSTGQPDYDKLAKLGAKYGIDAQTMDYSIDHIKKNWESFVDVAKNKGKLGVIAPEGAKKIQENVTNKWSTQPTSESTTQQPKVPVTPTKAVETSTLGVAPVKSAVEADQTGSAPSQSIATKAPVDEGKAMDLGSGIVTGKADQAQRFTLPPQSEPDIFAPTPEPISQNLYGEVNKMEVNTPTPGTATIKPISKVDISGLNQETKNDAIRGLRAKGVSLPPDNKITKDNIDDLLAQGFNEVRQNAVSSLYKGYNPLEPEKAIGSIYEAQALTPETAQKAFDDVLARGREIKTTKLGNKTVEQAYTQSGTKFSQSQDPINYFRGLGIAANEGNISDIMAKHTSVEALKTVTKSIEDKLNSEEYTHQSNEEFAQDLKTINNLLSQAEGANTESLHKALEAGIRPPQSVAGIWNKEGPSITFFREYFKNLTSQEKGVVLDIYHKWAKDALLNGKATSDFNALPKVTKWSKEKPGKGAKATKKDTSARKPGESFADYLRRSR